MCVQSGDGGSETSPEDPGPGTTGDDESGTGTGHSVPTTGDEPPDIGTTTAPETMTSGEPVDTTTGTTDQPPDTTTGTTGEPIDTTTGTTDDPGETTGDLPDVCEGFECQADEMCVAIGGAPVCLPLCQPLLEQCGADEVCAQANDLFVCASDASGDGGAVGDDCQFANACDDGNVCLSGDVVSGCDGPSCCSTFCDLSQPDPCGPLGMQCHAWFEQGEAPAGFEDLGVCASL
jgi:hypothetical protein